jgi:hypothetical protein
MPKVGKKEFPYTAKGKKMAKAEEMKMMKKKAPAKKAAMKKMGKKK